MVIPFTRLAPQRVRERQPDLNVVGAEVPLPPEWWLSLGGSAPEYYIYRALLKRGLREGQDFTYQADFGGGRLDVGGAIVDFLIEFPRVAIDVQSDYWHLGTAEQRAHDVAIRSMLEGFGIRVEYIDEDEAINDADRAVDDAITGTRATGPIGL